MTTLGRTLSVAGLIALALLIAVILRAIGTGEMRWLRAIAVAVVAGLCFWGAERVKGRA